MPKSVKYRKYEPRGYNTAFFQVLKVLNATDEYVMAFEATFSNVADSHLVCIQEGANYKTQSINLEGQEHKSM